MGLIIQSDRSLEYWGRRTDCQPGGWRVGRSVHRFQKALCRRSGSVHSYQGPHHDGHRYLDEAYRSGIRNFLVSDGRRLATRRQLSAGSRYGQGIADAGSLSPAKQFAYPVIGITGSNGKTVVKEWIYHLLKTQEDIIRNPRSFNSQTGVPISVWYMDHHHTLAVFEAGISRPGEMDHLAEVIRPDIGVFTHFGPAHAGFIRRGKGRRES